VGLFVGICFYFLFETILMKETSEILMQFFFYLYLGVVKLGITKASF